MEIFTISSNKELFFCKAKRRNSDEKIVRKELVRVWTRFLEKYAHPGIPVPSEDFVRRELIKLGVNAAVDALGDEHWYFFSFMARDEIREKIERQLDRIDLGDFLEDVREAQTHPEVLEHLRDQIRSFVMGNF